MVLTALPIKMYMVDLVRQRLSYSIKYTTLIVEATGTQNLFLILKAENGLNTSIRIIQGTMVCFTILL